VGLNAALRALSDVSKSPQDRKQLVQDLLDTGLPAFEKQLRQMQKNIAAAGPQPPSASPPPRDEWGRMESCGRVVLGLCEVFLPLSVPWMVSEEEVFRAVVRGYGDYLRRACAAHDAETRFCHGLCPFRKQSAPRN
jgi:hypothetical protein